MHNWPYSGRMLAMTEIQNIDEKAKDLRVSGAHYGFSKSRRHPSMKDFIETNQGENDIIDIQKTISQIKEATDFLKALAEKNKAILFVGTKAEAKRVVEENASSRNLPYVSSRWVPGTLTNWTEVKKRVKKLEDNLEQKNSGEINKYTKKERLMIDKENEKLERDFTGLRNMDGMPDAVVIIDPRNENVAVDEAVNMNIPVIALANTDCDISKITYPIVANDASLRTIEKVVKELANAASNS